MYPNVIFFTHTLPMGDLADGMDFLNVMAAMVVWGIGIVIWDWWKNKQKTKSKK